MSSITEENNEKNFRNWLGNKFPNGWYGYHPCYILAHPWEIFEYYCGELKCAWQRVFRGWDDTVIWNLDWYLSKMIPIWIKVLKNKKHSIPQEMFDGLPYDNNYCYSNENEKIAENKWSNILDKIAKGFESYCKIQNKGLCKKEAEFFELNESYEVGFDLFKKYFSNLWD